MIVIWYFNIIQFVNGYFIINSSFKFNTFMEIVLLQYFLHIDVIGVIFNLFLYFLCFLILSFTLFLFLLLFQRLLLLSLLILLTFFFIFLSDFRYIQIFHILDGDWIIQTKIKSSAFMSTIKAFHFFNIKKNILTIVA